MFSFCLFLVFGQGIFSLTKESMSAKIEEKEETRQLLSNNEVNSVNSVNNTHGNSTSTVDNASIDGDDIDLKDGNRNGIHRVRVDIRQRENRNGNATSAIPAITANITIVQEKKMKQS